MFSLQRGLLPLPLPVPLASLPTCLPRYLTEQLCYEKAVRALSKEAGNSIPGFPNNKHPPEVSIEIVVLILVLMLIVVVILRGGTGTF